MARIQGWYYFLGGIWPLIRWRSFTSVAGPKPDRFQTDITAGLFTSIGATLLNPGNNRESNILAASSATACIAIDLRHLRKIRKVFLFDALLNAAFLLVALRRLLSARSERALG